jgi:hypothetical protein
MGQALPCGGGGGSGEAGTACSGPQQSRAHPSEAGMLSLFGFVVLWAGSEVISLPPAARCHLTSENQLHFTVIKNLRSDR